jgi:hypothetical protein
MPTTPEQFKALRATQLAYRDALNYVSQYAFVHGKMSHKVRLHISTYPEVCASCQLKWPVAFPVNLVSWCSYFYGMVGWFICTLPGFSMT